MENIYGGVLAQPGLDFQAIRNGLRSPLAHFDVDLSTARSIAAGTAQLVEVSGDALICDMDPTMQGQAVIHVQDTVLSARTAPVYVTPGSIIKAPFTRLLIENAAQAGLRLRVFYGVGIDFQAGAGANVTVSGTVAVVDGGKARTLTNQAFLSALDRNAGAAGEFTQLELWNPAGSGKRAIVKSLYGFSSTAGFAQVRFSTVARTASYGAAANPVSKLAGGAVSSMENRVQTSVAVNNTGSMLDQFSMAANTLATKNYSEPLVILPGSGLLMFHTTAVSPFNGGFEFVEETI